MQRRRTRGRAAALLALTALLAIGLGACGDDDDAGQTTETTAEEVEGSDEITISYVDYAYEVSGPLTAGGTITFQNEGEEFHMAAMGRLEPGKTIDDVTALLQEGEDGEGEGGDGEVSPTVETTRASRSQAQTTTTTRSQAQTSTTVSGGAGGGQEEDGEGEEGGDGEGGEGEEGDPFEGTLTEVGMPANLMGPGAQVSVTVPDLEPGNYALICFLGTEGSGEPHFSQGMINELQVVEGTVPEPEADSTYTVSAGEIDGPAELTAGEHTLKFETSGLGENEPLLARVDDGTSFERFFGAVGEALESEPPPEGAAERIPGDLLFAGHNLAEVTTFYLTMDFVAGTYYLGVPDIDAESEEMPDEVLEVTVG